MTASTSATNFFFFQAEDGIRDHCVTGVQTCALPISFSIVSAPHENELMVATRMRDTAFKRVLKAMPADGRVGLRGPAGMFTLDGADGRPAVFLAGGIGITPFVSMSRQAAHDRLPPHNLA